MDLPGIRICRTALIVPMMVSAIVGALYWKLLLDSSHGVINDWIGQHVLWLDRPDTALAAISAPGSTRHAIDELLHQRQPDPASFEGSSLA